MNQPADLTRLTGVRSGKNSYYPAFVRTTERMQRTVRAMERISEAVVRTVEGPRGLLEEVARAAAEHLDADWVILALSDGHLAAARPRFITIGPGLVSHDRAVDLPEQVRLELSAVRSGFAAPTTRTDDWVRVPMSLEGRRVGGLSARHRLEHHPEPDDLAALRILANQAAMSLHTSEQYQAGVNLHRQAQRLKRDAQAQARDLNERTAELHAAERRLAVAMQRELVDTERHRIARELHDSVTQYVLSAGMAMELARGDLGAGDIEEAAGRLGEAKHLTQTAVSQLRSAIYALAQSHSESVATLGELLDEVVAHHRSLLDVRIVAEGRATDLGEHVHHELARAVGEALFNVVSHSGATRAVIRLRYREGELRLSVADDGCGDPGELRRMLRLEQRVIGDGRHRGLANMDERVRALGGSLAFRRARLGGIRVCLVLPLPVAPVAAGVCSGADAAVSADVRETTPTLPRSARQEHA